MYEQGKNNFWWFLRVSKPSYFNFEPYMSKLTERSKELYHHQVGTTFYVLVNSLIKLYTPTKFHQNQIKTVVVSFYLSIPTYFI